MSRIFLHRKGFTLIELLLVIGIVGVLSSIVIVAVNPAEQLQKARDARRTSYALQLEKALGQYIVKEMQGQIPTEIPQASYAPKEICADGQSDFSCIDMSYLAPEYIAEIPQDAQEQNALYSGFKVYQENNSVFVKPVYGMNGLLTSTVAHWNFDEPAGSQSFADVSGNGYTATCTTTCPTSGADGRDGSAIYPNTLSKYLTFTDPLVGAKGATICSWVYKTGSRQSSAIISDYVSPGSLLFILGYEYPTGSINPISYIGNGPSATSLYGGNWFTLNTWHHVCLVFDSLNGKMISYVDDHSASGNVTYTSLGPTQSSRRNIGAYANYYSFIGYIDDIRLYDVALSANDIAALRTGTADGI